MRRAMMLGSEGESGFTLLELIVVVAIIGILASLAIANFAVFKSNALNATAASDARGLVPGADYASSRTATTTTYSLPYPNGGEVSPDILGGKSSPGTVGTVVVCVNEYAIQTYQLGGGLYYTVKNGVMMVSDVLTSATC